VVVRKDLTRLENHEADEHRRPLIGIALLPSAATLGNLLCGAFAVLCCLLQVRDAYFDNLPVKVHPARLNELYEHIPTWISVGCYLIIAAMIFDGLDGRLARMARRTSEFGAQLDSIADVVSFGVAPAMLLLTRMMVLAVPERGLPEVSRLEWRVALMGAVVYLSCAAIRLARYNAENVKDEAGQRRFSGLPTPGAAAGLIALIAVHEEFFHEGVNFWGVDWSQVLRWGMGPAAFALGLLMVGRLPFMHVVNVYVHREHPLAHLVVFIVILVGVAWYWPHLLLLAIAYTYILGSLVYMLLRLRPQRHTGTLPKTEPLDVN
jgi:CDP-diacylglycerol---serine O-phosphatidyltransferase